ncbi:MAG: hypothetical protein AAAC47_00285 [Pararhizobium sp.]
MALLSDYFDVFNETVSAHGGEKADADRQPDCPETEATAERG